MARMSEGRTVKKVFKNTPKRKRFFKKPRKRWLQGLENDLKKRCVLCWRKIAMDRDA
jgi:hypothetical protein